MRMLLTIGDVARLAGVTPDAVRAWERAGRLQAFRTAGGVRLFREAKVQKFLAARAQPRTPRADAAPPEARRQCAP